MRTISALKTWMTNGALTAAVGALGLAVTAGAEPPQTWNTVPDDEQYDYWRPMPDDWGRPASPSYESYFWDDPYWGPYDAQRQYNDDWGYRYYESGFNQSYPMNTGHRGYFFYTEDWHSDNSRFDSWYDGWGL